VANVIFAGSQSAQAVSGETVTVTVTKPDKTTDTLLATTASDGSYSVTKQYTVLGSYSAVAAGAADAQFSSWASSVASFTIGLTTRTGTLIVTLG